MSGRPRHELRALGWSIEVGCLADALERLARVVKEDIRLDDPSSLVSLRLFIEVARYLEAELQDQGASEVDDDAEERRERVLRALDALVRASR